MPGERKGPFLNGPGIYFRSANNKEVRRPVFSDSGRTTPHSNPMYYDIDGKWPSEIYFQGSKETYYMYVHDKDGRDIFGLNSV